MRLGSAGVEQDYDLMIVPLQRQQLDALIPVLAANGSKRILLALNNATDADSIDELLGAERVTCSGPGFGRSDGRVTEDLRTIKGIFDDTGVPSVITTQIDEWLKHVRPTVSGSIAPESALLLEQLAVLARRVDVDSTPLTDLASAIPETRTN